MLVYLGDAHYLGTKLALNLKRVNNFLDDSRCPTNFDVFMAHRAFFIQDKPIFNAQLAKQLVAVVTLLCIATHL